MLSAFFSAAESAYISLGEIDLIELEKTTDKKAKALLRLLKNKERLLSVILIGNNLVNISASALATALAITMAPQLGMSDEWSVLLAAIALTLIILIFGEVTPKSLALIHNRGFALSTTPIISFLSLLLFPASSLLERIAQSFARGKNPLAKISEATVINLVNKGEQLGIINEREKNLIEKVFLFDEREVYPIMTPRTQVFALTEDSTLDEAKEELLKHQFSRVPIYKDRVDNVTGVVYLKNILFELLQGQGGKALSEIAQKALFIYETLPLSSLLERFRKGSNHLAIVVDEYGGMLGIVTLEDILEELVGEIFDEKDQVTTPVKPMGHMKWLAEGSIDLITLNRGIAGEVPEKGDFESLQGLIMHHLSRLPHTGDSLVVGDHRLTVMKMQKNEILSVMIEYLVLPKAEH